MLNQSQLLQTAYELKETYQSAEPFPHIVIDDFLPGSIAAQVYDQFPSFDQMDPETYQEFEHKIATRPNIENFPQELKTLLYTLNSHEIITFLEVITGIDGLIADPHFLGAGLMQVKRGGQLKMHIDFNYHKHLKLERRVNMLIFLNKDWQEEYGGHLQLWNKEMTTCVQKVLPTFNRCVIFSTSNDSWHGHPEPLNCPEHMTRKCINLYFYSSDRPAEEQAEPFWTKHQKRPGLDDDFEEYKARKSGGNKNIVRSLINRFGEYLSRC